MKGILQFNEKYNNDFDFNNSLFRYVLQLQ